MPKFLENKLKAAASTKGLSGKKAAGYVFGALNNMGAMKGSKVTPKGAAMDLKHEADTESHAYDWRKHQGRPRKSA